MFNQKRGLSTVVTTLIIILLVLVAIGIIWVVIKGVVQTGSESVDYAVKCLNVDVKATSVLCDAAMSAVCNVTVSRKAGGDPITGIKMVFYNASGASGTTNTTVGSVDPSQTKTINWINSNMTIPKKIDVIAYFNDAAGNPQVCNPSSFSF